MEFLSPISHTSSVQAASGSHISANKDHFHHSRKVSWAVLDLSFHFP